MVSFNFLFRNAIISKCFPKLPPPILPKATPFCYRSLCTVNSGGNTNDMEISAMVEKGMEIVAMVERAKIVLGDLQLAVNNHCLPPDLLQVVTEAIALYTDHKGAKLPIGVKEDDDSLYVRIDMPGVHKKGVKVWMHHNYLYFSGEAEKELPELEFPNMNHTSMKYGSRFYLDPRTYRSAEMKAVMKNGVLRIVVPKSKTFTDEAMRTFNLDRFGTFHPVEVEYE